MSYNLEELWNTYEKLCFKLGDPAINEMIDQLGERLIASPISLTNETDGYMPGSLIDNTLNITYLMTQLNTTLSLGCPTKSVLRVGLLHQIGRMGDLTHDLIIPNDSQWHREKLGQMNKYNDKIMKMSTQHRTAYLLQHFGVKLNNDEWLAIQLSQTSIYDTNSFYYDNIPNLAFLLQNAKMSTHYTQKKFEQDI